MRQSVLALETAAINVRRFVKFVATPQAARWRVIGGTGRWRERSGQEIGILSLRNARAFCVLLQFDDGQVASFHPNDLLPDPTHERF